MIETSDAVDALRQLIRPTTIIQCDELNELAGTKIVLASETFQRTGSFKFRAALNAAQNTKAQKLICASSGNFGQALAYACKLLKKDCTVVMPSHSAKVKVDAVRRHGGTVELVDIFKTTRAQRVKELARENPDAAVVSAFDDPFVIEGNATLGEELAALHSMFDCVIVPVGGGGLVSGIIQGMRRKGCTKPVYGAEPAIANDAARSLKAGELVKNEKEPQTIADGVRTLSLGEKNWQIIRDNIAAIIEVPEATIVQAFKALFLTANLKIEPTGALSLAAAMTAPDQFAGKTVCCIVSGGNIDPPVLHDLLSQ
jgi:threonine dehydratase